jgi:chromosome segregation ATPase
MAITKTDIHNAADAIAAQGDTPTLAKVRAALGGGSFTTISEAMGEWKAARQQQSVVTPIREAAPEAITERLHGFAADIWGTAMEKANARLQEEREALDEARKKMEATLAETQELAAQVSADLDAAQERIEEQAQAIEQAGAAAAAQAAQVLDLESRLAAQTDAAHTAAAALEEARKRVDQLTDLLNQERTARSDAEQNANQASQAAAKAEAEAIAAQRRADEAEKREKAAAERASKAEEEAKQAREDAQNARIEEGRASALVAAANAAAEAARAETVTARAEANKAIGEAGELRGKLAGLESELQACLKSSAKK